MTREPRELKELADALVKHVALLQDYAEKCFVEGETHYGGEIAGKLRLLVARFGSNRPLLLDLMNELESTIRITLDGPPVRKRPGEPGPGDEVTLEEYLNLGAIGTRIPTGEFVMLSKIDLIRGWAEQTGSSHEDWKMDPALRSALEAPIQIFGLPASTQELKITTNAVLGVAHQFVEELRIKDVFDA